MQLHCLGTAGYHPNGSRHTSCYFLPESGIVLDAGSGLFRLAPLVQTDSLDILLSHAHLDHTFGLTFLLDVLYELESVHKRPVRQLRIWGEAEKLDAIRQHLFSELIFPVQLDQQLGAQWCEIDDLDEFTIGQANGGGQAQVRWRRQQHPGGSVAYRLDWKKQADQGEKKLVYATDTTGDLSDEASRWSGQADLLMHECYFGDSGKEFAEKTGHCWTSRLIDVVRRTRPGKTLVTHLNPLDLQEDPVAIERIRRSVDGEIILADDQLVIDF